MSSKIRREIARAKLNQDAFTMVLGEIALVSAGAGILAGSWWVFGAVLIALVISLGIRRIAICLVVVLSLAWGAVGALIGMLAASVVASVFLAILGFVGGLGTHLWALDWVEDISSGGE